MHSGVETKLMHSQAHHRSSQSESYFLSRSLEANGDGRGLVARPEPAAAFRYDLSCSKSCLRCASYLAVEVFRFSNWASSIFFCDCCFHVSPMPPTVFCHTFRPSALNASTPLSTMLRSLLEADSGDEVSDRPGPLRPMFILDNVEDAACAPELGFEGGPTGKGVMFRHLLNAGC